MSNRTFQLRLHSRHTPPERQTTNLVVDYRNEQGSWEPQQLSLTLPGFRLYLISLLLCQHFYLVANALERQIPLHAVEADVVVTTSHDWIVTAVEGEFRIQLDPSASPQQHQLVDGGVIASILERMKLCPVSRNLPAGAEKRIDLTVLA